LSIHAAKKFREIKKEKKHSAAAQLSMLLQRHLEDSFLAGKTEEKCGLKSLTGEIKEN
jgi:hypothetical protein